MICVLYEYFILFSRSRNNSGVKKISSTLLTARSIRLEEGKQILSYFIFKKIMERESDYGNDGLDPSAEYFRKKKKGNDEDTYSPPEGSEPLHY